jgi:hypothetical protein
VREGSRNARARDPFRSLVRAPRAVTIVRMSNTAAYDRFVSSMTITQEMWHDGIGYDVEALDEMNADEVRSLVSRMRPCGDWRDVEALAAIAGMEDAKAADAAKEALRARAGTSDEVALRAAEALRDMGEAGVDLEAHVVETLLRMEDNGAFGEALEQSEEYPSERVKLALLKCAKEHPSQGVHCAAMLYYHAGLAKEAFDWDHRPFFLRFNPDDEEDRARAFEELCQKTGLRLS